MQPLLGSLFTAGTAFALGWLLTRRLNVPSFIRFAVGAAGLHLLVFVLLLAGVARWPVLAMVGFCSITVWLWSTQAKAPAPLPLAAWTFLPVSLFAVLYLIHALAPEIQMDANVYHLAPAIEASRSGGFTRDMSFYDRLPHATELLFVFAYAFGVVPAAKLLHLIFLFWTLPGIVAIGRRLGLADPLPAMAAAMYFVTPVVAVSAASAFNDAALVFYIICTVWLLLERSHALLTGFCAGMCYAIKMNGGVAIAAAGMFILATRRRAALLPFTLGAAVMTLPWLIRNTVDTGNPFAPFFNGLFENEYFYSGVEQQLVERLRTYGVPFWQRFWEVTAGWRLQGAIGPVFLLAPLTLLAAHRSSVRSLWLIAAVFSAGWWMNAGARFLLPALPFLALAFAAASPRRVAVALLVVHALLSWPWMISAYSPRMWRLAELPWRAAMGWEPAKAYLDRVSWDYRLARLIDEKTSQESRIFDLAGLHKAHLDRRIVGSWQSAEGHRFLTALELARSAENNTLMQWQADFEARAVTAVRLRRASSQAGNWSLNEVLLYHAGERLPNRRRWRLDASVNRWDAPLAFDRGSITRWATWRTPNRDDYFAIDFDGSEEVDSIRATAPVYESEVRPIIELKKPDGAWITFPVRQRTAPTGRLRLQAVRRLAREGVTHIVASASPEGIGVLGQSLVDEAHDWGLEVVANHESVYLLRLR